MDGKWHSHGLRHCIVDGGRPSQPPGRKALGLSDHVWMLAARKGVGAGTRIADTSEAIVNLGLDRPISVPRSLAFHLKLVRQALSVPRPHVELCFCDIVPLPSLALVAFTPQHHPA